MSADKYPSIFSRQMETIVNIYSQLPKNNIVGAPYSYIGIDIMSNVTRHRSEPLLKRSWMFVVSLRRVNQGFRFHSGCSGRNQS